MTEYSRKNILNTTAKALCAVSAASIIWGATPLFSKILLQDGTPLTLTCLRFFISSFSIFVFLAFTGRFHFPNREHLASLLVLGILSVSLTNTASFTGLQYSTVVHSALIAALSPSITALLACIILKEHLVFIQWIGIIIALFGVLFLLTGGNISTLTQFKINQGDTYFLFAQFSWALYTLFSLRALKQMSILDVVAWSGFFGASINFVYGSYTGALQIPDFSIRSLLCLAYLIWLSAMTGTILWNYGIKCIGPSLSAIFINLATLIGVASGVFFLNEPFAMSQVWGGVIIIFGIVLLTQHLTLLRIINQYRNYN